jgi:hypothetical protein
MIKAIPIFNSILALFLTVAAGAAAVDAQTVERFGVNLDAPQ